jgi:hypothetical protein
MLKICDFKFEPYPALVELAMDIVYIEFAKPSQLQQSPSPPLPEAQMKMDLLLLRPR